MLLFGTNKVQIDNQAFGPSESPGQANRGLSLLINPWQGARGQNDLWATGTN